jgi:peptidoglycan/xylan/chitin deacetylase (PgdA/CDA1 family)
MTMQPRDRLRYAAPADRPRHTGPNGARLIVWPVVNVETWLIDNPMPRQVLSPPTGAALLPDVPNWAWHEYGMRVGFWRFHALFERLSIRPTLSVNGSVIPHYPCVAAAARDAGWDFMGHGWFQVPTHRVEDQRAMIAQTTAAIADFTGRPCEGWLGPGLTETLDTPDLLAEHGIAWTGDFVVDDLPARIATTHGDLLALPYPVELNDIPVVMIQHHDESELPRRARLAAARLLAEAEAASGVKVMGIAIHPYITGVPHRIAALEALFAELAADPRVAFLQGGEIAAWYRASGDPA